MKISFAASLLCALALTACLNKPAANHETHHAEAPSKTEKIMVDGAEVTQLTLTEKARERLGIASQLPRPLDASHFELATSSLLYDSKGSGWVYVETQANSFIRISVEVIDARGATLTAKSRLNPALPVVVTGAAELYGAELGVGH